MPEPLTIYECPMHGIRGGAQDVLAARRLVPCPECVPVRVFREDDLLTDEFIRDAYFPLGPDDDSLVPVARKNMRRALGAADHEQQAGAS